MKLTKRIVDAARPRATRYMIWDEEIRGLGLRIEPKGTKTYLVRYRPGGGRSAALRQMTLGRHGVLTPEQARIAARLQLAEVARGADPVARRSAKRKEQTVEHIVHRYIEEHVKIHNKPTTIKESIRIARNEIIPAFRTVRIGDLTRPMIRSWHMGYSDRPYQGNRCLAVLRKVLSLAVHDWELRSDNPALGIKQFRETKRERFSNDDDLRRIGAWLRAVEAAGEQPLSAIVATRLLALTGMRLGEVLGLRWEHVDLRAGLIRLSDAKAGARTVPLGASAVAFLTSIRASETLTGPIARNFDGSPLHRSRYRKFWNSLRLGTGILDLRPHDFRHGAATFGAQSGANAFLLRDFMGHSTIAMTGAYVSRVVDPIRVLANVVSERVSDALNADWGQIGAQAPSPRSTQ
jgi:integrase